MKLGMVFGWREEYHYVWFYFSSVSLKERSVCKFASSFRRTNVPFFPFLLRTTWCFFNYSSIMTSFRKGDRVFADSGEERHSFQVMRRKDVHSGFSELFILQCSLLKLFYAWQFLLASGFILLYTAFLFPSSELSFFFSRYRSVIIVVHHLSARRRRTTYIALRILLSCAVVSRVSSDQKLRYNTIVGIVPSTFRFISSLPSTYFSPSLFMIVFASACHCFHHGGFEMVI